MNEQALRDLLRELPLGELRFHAQAGSTNDIALRWAMEGASDLSLVVVDHQTEGRGRAGRTWHNSPGAGLAFSLVLRAEGDLPASLPYNALGALAVTCALEAYGLHPQIKWPNDILLENRKVSGILTEVNWSEAICSAVVVGIGVNVHPLSLSIPEQTEIPATCVDRELGTRVDRWMLLRDILGHFLSLRSQLGTADFLSTWETRLAWRGEMVTVLERGGSQWNGRIIGLEADGSLRMTEMDGKPYVLMDDEAHLRPVL